MTRFLSKRSKRLARRRGFTLMEMTFVLLVAGFLIAAVWVAAGSTWDSYRTSRTSQQITKITQNIREYYMNAQQLPWASPTDITTNLDQLSLLPLEMRRTPSGGAGGLIDHPMNNSLAGGSFHVLSMTCPGVATGCFRIRMEGLSVNQCIALLGAVAFNDADLGVAKFGTQDMALGTTTPTGISIASTAQAWCNQAGTGNEVDWDFKLHN